MVFREPSPSATSGGAWQVLLLLKRSFTRTLRPSSRGERTIFLAWLGEQVTRDLPTQSVTWAADD